MSDLALRQSCEGAQCGGLCEPTQRSRRFTVRKAPDLRSTPLAVRHGVLGVIGMPTEGWRILAAVAADGHIQGARVLRVVFLWPCDGKRSEKVLQRLAPLLELPHKRSVPGPIGGLCRVALYLKRALERLPHRQRLRGGTQRQLRPSLVCPVHLVQQVADCRQLPVGSESGAGFLSARAQECPVERVQMRSEGRVERFPQRRQRIARERDRVLHDGSSVGWRRRRKASRIATLEEAIHALVRLPCIEANSFGATPPAVDAARGHFSLTRRAYPIVTRSASERRRSTDCRMPSGDANDHSSDLRGPHPRRLRERQHRPDEDAGPAHPKVRGGTHQAHRPLRHEPFPWVWKDFHPHRLPHDEPNGFDRGRRPFVPSPPP